MQNGESFGRRRLSAVKPTRLFKILLFRLGFILIGTLIGTLAGAFSAALCYELQMHLSAPQNYAVLILFGLFGFACGVWAAITFKAPKEPNELIR
jgi:sulfite exporter TauE/SafE